MNDTAPLLQLEHVSKRYQPIDGLAVDVLADISFTMIAGQSLAIVGPSGSGKSTLLNIIGMLDRPTGGRVLLGGEDVGRLDDRAQAAVRNRQIGFVFQAHHLLPQCTVLENVLVPTLARRDKPARDKLLTRAQQLLGRVGLGERLSHRPGELSGGECQRVAVARALINEPVLLLADEPTGSLDRAAADSLGELLMELNVEAGLTMVVVTHTQRLANRMQRVMSLRDGALAMNGGRA